MDSNSLNNNLIISSRRRSFNKITSMLGESCLLLITSASLFTIIFIFYFIAKDAFPFFSIVSAKEFFTNVQWYPTGNPESFGALSIFYGSAIVTLGAIVVAVPLGVIAAVSLSDILPFKVRQYAKPIIELLAAIPSVTYGFFALMVFAPWLQSLGIESGTNAFNVSIILGIMALPTIVSVSEDALQAVGRDMREASYALGATRAETLIKVVIPSAASGICAAVILGIMRAIGETMVVWMASGNAAQIPTPWFDIFEPVRTLTATIAGDMGESDQVMGSARYHVLFAMALCLLVISFSLNFISELILRRSRRKLSGR